jgi:hypothetical protein
MKSEYLFFVLFLLVLSSGISAQKTLFETFKQQKAAGKETTLPDFSYVGYEYGEKSIPQVDYKVFNVKDFGAVPNDDKSDKPAIQKCINAAVQNGSGVVCFPKGQYLVNEKGESETPILIDGSRIVLRGETGAVLFMKEHMTATDPTKLWSTPCLFQFKAKREIGKTVAVLADAQAGSFEIQTENMRGIAAGDWIELNLQNNNPERVAKELSPYTVNPDWTEIVQKGVIVKVFHKVKEVKNGKIQLADPVMYPIIAADRWTISKWEPATECGVENLCFKGNYREKFVHHRSAIDDGGWSILMIANQVNSWMKDCIFEDVSNAARINQCANYTVLNCKVIGNGGHAAISSEGSSRVLIAKCVDDASQWHSFGVAKPAMNTVVWRCKSAPTTSFESHASQPRNTLIDNQIGGFIYSRYGGAIHALPNHLQNLILWNFNATNTDIKKSFEFWDSNSIWLKIPMPTIAGFRGAKVDFNTRQLKNIEALGTIASPESLYEAQLELRLGKLPRWVMDAKNDQANPNSK